MLTASHLARQSGELIAVDRAIGIAANTYLTAQPREFIA
jgi:hypothetical protein